MKIIHPNVISGSLKNGFRYIVLPNQISDKRVFMYLHVAVGSCDEEENEKGLAHFLEHMAFQGSKNFPKETFLKSCEQHEIDFGRDMNAATSFNQTHYSIFLKDEKPMEFSLKVLADFAMNLSFNPDAIEAERGVILNEKRERDGQEIVDQIQCDIFYMGFSPSLKYRIIGKEETIKSFQQEDFFKFYHTWYRPENMTLIVVGHITPDSWLQAIEKQFQDFQGKAPAKAKKNMYAEAQTKHEGIKSNVIVSEDAIKNIISLGVVFQDCYKQEDLHEEIKTSLMISYLSSALSRRSKYVDKKFKLRMQLASLDLDELTDTTYFLNAVASCEGNQWAETLTLLENEVRRLMLYGISETEFELLKKIRFSALDKNKINEVESSLSLVKELVYGLNQPYVFASTKQSVEKMCEVLEETTAKDCQDFLVKYWSSDHRLISLFRDEEIPDSQNIINEVYAKAKDMPLTALVVTESNIPNIAAIVPEKKGEVVRYEYLEKNGIEKFYFKNNVKAVLKKTGFKKDQVSMRVYLGRDALSGKKSYPGLLKLLEIAMASSGISGLSVEDLENMKALEQVGFAFYFRDEETFVFSNTMHVKEITTFFQFLYLYFMNPGFSEDILERYFAILGPLKGFLEREIDDYQYYLLSQKLLGESSIQYQADEKILRQYNIADVESLMIPVLTKGPIGISIAGDFDSKEVEEQISLYFGSLPERDEWRKPERFHFKPFFEKHRFKSKLKKTLMTLLLPANIRGKSLEEFTYLVILTKILQTRLYKRIREELSLTYSPTAAYCNKVNCEEYIIKICLDIDSKNYDIVYQEIVTMIEALQQQGVTEDEMTETRKLLLSMMGSMSIQDSVWLDRMWTLHGAEPKEDLYDERKAYQAMQLDDFNAYIRKYLDLKKAGTLIIETYQDDADKSPQSDESP